jgi:hypothetical protein
VIINLDPVKEFHLTNSTALYSETTSLVREQAGTLTA